MRFIIFVFSFLLIFSTARADEKLNQVLKELQQIKKDLQTLEQVQPMVVLLHLVEQIRLQVKHQVRLLHHLVQQKQ